MDSPLCMGHFSRNMRFENCHVIFGPQESTSTSLCVATPFWHFNFFLFLTSCIPVLRPGFGSPVTVGLLFMWHCCFFFSKVNVLHFGAIFCTSKKMPFWVWFRFCALGKSFSPIFFSKHPLCRISDRIRGSTHQEGSNNASFTRIRSVVWTWIANKAVFAFVLYLYRDGCTYTNIMVIGLTKRCVHGTPPSCTHF